jgi:DNA polymerase III subunit delta
MARGADSERGFDDLRNGDLKTRDYRPVYVLDGPDTYRLESVVDRLQADALDAASAAFNLHHLQGDQAGWQQVLQQAGSYPLLGSRQLVRVRHVDRMTKDEDGEAALLAYFADPMPTTILILTAEKLDRRRTWVQDARKKGYLFTFAAPEGAQLFAWARKAADRAKLIIDDRTLQTLVDLVGRDLRTLDGEIEKLALLAGTWGRAPTVDDVVKVVMDQAELEAFAITDVLQEGSTAEALRIWNRLREWGEDPQGLAPLVLSHLRRAALVAAMMQAGVSPPDIAQATRINGWLVGKKLAPVARANAADGGRRLLTAAMSCERSLKRSPVPTSLAFENMLFAATMAPKKGES